MLKHLNDLLCFQFKHFIKCFLSMSHVTFLFHLYVWWCPWTISKFLQCFLKLVFFPLSFDISSGKHLILTKFSLFLKPTCLLLGIFLKFIFDHKEKHGFIWHKTSFFVSKTSDFLFRKKEVFLENSSCWIFYFFWSQRVYCLPPFENLYWNRRKSVALFGPKRSMFHLKNIWILILKKELFLENSCSWISKI